MAPKEKAMELPRSEPGNDVERGDNLRRDSSLRRKLYDFVEPNEVCPHSSSRLTSSHLLLLLRSYAPLGYNEPSCCCDPTGSKTHTARLNLVCNLPAGSQREGAP